jgi:ribosome-binding factor A
MSRASYKRTARIASLIREVLSEVIRVQVKDPRVQAISLTDVEVTGDLREAKIFFAHHGSEADEKQILKALRKASGFLRRELGQKVSLRVTPALKFVVDHSLDYGARIEAVLRDIKTPTDEVMVPHRETEEPPSDTENHGEKES